MQPPLSRARAGALLVVLLLVTLGAGNPTPTARQDGTPYVMDGITVSAPPGWRASEPSFGLMAEPLVVFLAPACADGVAPPCDPGAGLSLLVGARAGDDARADPEARRLVERGYGARPVTVQGHEGTMLEPPDDGGQPAAALFLATGGVVYRAVLTAPPEQRALARDLPAQALEGADLRPQELLDLRQRLAAALEPAPLAPEAAVAANSPNAFVAFDKVRALAYAQEWVGQFDNGDNCYVGDITGTTTTRCINLLPPSQQGTRRDAAHFLGCALDAGGIEQVGGKRTCGEPGWANAEVDPGGSVIVNFETLTPLSNLPAGWQTRPSLDEVQPGDLVVFSTSAANQCWGGLIVSVDSTNKSYTFAQHSTLEQYSTITPKVLPYCFVNEVQTLATPTFIAINADLTAPEDPKVAGGVTDYPPRAATITWTAGDGQSGIGGATESRPPAGRWGGGYLAQVWTGAAWQDLGAPVTLAEAAQGPQTITLDLTPYAGMCEAVRVRLAVRDNVGNEAVAETTVSVLQEGDLTADGAVNQGDLDALAPHLGAALTAENARFDLTGDGQITAADRLWLLQRQGATCAIRNS